jgi:hypothetical protein
MSVSPPRTCIFCGSGNVSKEHFWPQWARPLLPEHSDKRHAERFTIAYGDRLAQPPIVRTKPGQAWTKAIRAVCQSCNNGWMNQVEEAARPVLTPLILGEPQIITAELALPITYWIVLKSLVGEENRRGDNVTSQEERALFWATRGIPKNLKIWLANCGLDGWDTGYWRAASTFSKVGVTPVSHRKNIHSVTFGVGAMLVHLLHTTADEVDFNLTVEPGRVTQLYPFVGTIEWPPPKRLTGAEAGILANTLDRMYREHTLWNPFPA